jgi:hypothetical protein
MRDTSFRSGPWTGFYTYRGVSGNCPTDLSLSFDLGRMTGQGADSVGPFVIEGSYDTGSRECNWTKSYVGAHDVHYQGFAEGKGIWGTWQIPSEAQGGFHIWPLKEEHQELEAVWAEEEIPLEMPAPLLK